MDDQKKLILDFLKTQLLGVIATLDEKNNKPEAALVGFTELPTLELIFGTLNDTRKFANLQSNSKIAFVVPGPDMTVQYEGVARMVEGAELEECRNLHLVKNPRAARIANNEKQRFFKVKPTWLRYTNFASKPPHIFELTFEGV